MFCPECGTKNTDDAIYCENCGLNLKKTVESQSSPSSQSQSKSGYQPPLSTQTGAKYTGPAPIIDGLESASVADYRDTMSPMYYFLAFVFFPLGIFLWAFHRDKKPDSASNLFAATLAGMVVLILIFIL